MVIGSDLTNAGNKIPAPTHDSEDWLSTTISEKLSEHSIHPQETHVDGCSYEDDDTTCNCSYSFDFEQYPHFLKELTETIEDHYLKPEEVERVKLETAILYSLKACNDYKEFGEEYAYREAHKLEAKLSKLKRSEGNGNK